MNKALKFTLQILAMYGVSWIGLMWAYICFKIMGKPIVIQAFVEGGIAMAVLPVFFLTAYYLAGIHYKLYNKSELYE